MVGAQALAESRTMTESPVNAGLSSFREQFVREIHRRSVWHVLGICLLTMTVG
jgi:hypothetical protein